MTKFLIVIGSPRAYWSRNRRAYHWEYLLVVCILTRHTGTSKYGTTPKNKEQEQAKKANS